MDAFFSATRLIVTDFRYKEIYDLLNNHTGLNHSSIFLLALLLGIRNNRQSEDYKSGGAEFRPGYYKEEQRTIIYGVIFDLFGKEEFNNIGDPSVLKKIENKLQLFANGGMEILKEEFLADHMVDGEFISTYKDADIDLLRYLYETLSK